MINNSENHIINGVLLIYFHPIYMDANTISEHIQSFQNHSCYKVWTINSEFGFPKNLGKLSFEIILLHYSLFGSYPFKLSNKFLQYLKNQENSYKIAFFQDEHIYCQQRFELINEIKIQHIFSLLEPQFFKKTYYKYTTVDLITTGIPGYVSENLIVASKKYFVPDEKRMFDIGYRGRKLPVFMGKEALEKFEIADSFIKYSKNWDLKLNINTEESGRIYGDNWYKFISNCKGVIGVEAGVSIFDLEGTVFKEYNDLLIKNGRVTYEDLASSIDLTHYEGVIPYRCISPRHFEAAAFKVCQILFEGHYSGVLEPMKHYIPLYKDFSNIEQVINLFNDDKIRQIITQNAYDDLIKSGRYSYKQFIQDFDKILLEKGFLPKINQDFEKEITKILYRDYHKRILQKIPKFTLDLFLEFNGHFKKNYPKIYRSILTNLNPGINALQKLKKKFQIFMQKK